MGEFRTLPHVDYGCRRIRRNVFVAGSMTIKQHKKLTCPAVSLRHFEAGIPNTRLNNFHNSSENSIGSCLVLQSQTVFPLLKINVQRIPHDTKIPIPDQGDENQSDPYDPFYQ
jgi:hypothetical protein